MVIGDEFVWAHLPKTAGDCTHQLFRLIGLKDFVDNVRLRKKHDTFAQREKETGLDLTTRKRIMNIRRLPSWLLSEAKHRERGHGYPVDRGLICEHELLVGNC